MGSELIAVLHKLEQASSDQHIGTVAENLLEALSGNDKVSEKVSYYLTVKIYRYSGREL